MILITLIMSNYLIDTFLLFEYRPQYICGNQNFLSDICL